MADPVFILATPRSFSSVVCAMLGRHPGMYGLPETHLFGDETMAGWWQRSSEASHRMADGLLRAVAQICFQEQTERTIVLAEAWLKRRRSETSGMVFEELASALFPLILIDKSPSTVYSVESMRRVYRFFPQAKFIYLVRHPRGYCESVVKYMEMLAKPAYRTRERRAGGGKAPQWISDLAFFPYSAGITEHRSPDHQALDPQGGWYVLNMNVLTFLESIPGNQWMTVRGEELLRDPERGLAQLAEWIGLNANGEAIEQMMHPERSPYARFGPPGAPLGNDILFLERPVMRRARGRQPSLEGPLGWRPGTHGFLPQVIDLGRRLGYE
jgi:hypothetical protein